MDDSQHQHGAGATRGAGGDPEPERIEELRAVVFGGKFSGKTFLINTVFGKNETLKRTAQCKKLQGSVCGRVLTLVDTPGWWKHFPLSDTANFLKKELVQGVSLCHPGPHTILLIIEIDIPFTEKHRKAVEDHLGLLGGQIWKHALVLFTRSYSLKDRTIEEHIKNEGEALQWLIEKCGNRYLVFDNAVRDIKSLLEKIEEIVQSNGGAYFQIEKKILEETSEWKKTVTIKAKSRKSKLSQKRTDLRIALLGWVIAGKSSAGNTILNKSVFPTGQTTRECQSGHGDVDGRLVSVLDTPSWFKYFPSRYTPAWIKSEILKGVCQTHTPLHCIILVIPADTSFKEEQKKVIEDNMSFLGERVWRHTIVLFTWGDILGDLAIEQHIESEGEALQWVIEKCENRYHVFNNEERENRAQVTGLLQKIDDMVARNSSFHLSTDTFTERQGDLDTQAEASSDGSALQDIVRLVDEEWRRKDKELSKKISEVKAEFPKRGDRSIDFPPNFCERSSNTEAENYCEKQEPESCRTVQNEEKSIKLMDQVKEMLDREWSRREEAVMGRVLEMLSELRSEGHSEGADSHKERSRQKVVQWFQSWSEGYGSDSASLQSDT